MEADIRLQQSKLTITKMKFPSLCFRFSGWIKTQKSDACFDWANILVLTVAFKKTEEAHFIKSNAHL